MIKKRLLITIFGISMVSALAFTACGPKRENTETTNTTVAESSTDKEVTKEVTTEKSSETSSVKMDINFDVANHLDEAYADILSAFPNPASDDLDSDAGVRTVKYSDPEREFKLYNDGTDGYVLGAVSAKAGDLFSFTESKVALSDLLSQMHGDKEIGEESNMSYLTVGEKGDSNVVFQSQGYYFIVAVDKDEMVSKDAAAAIVTEDRAAFIKKDGSKDEAESSALESETKAAQ